MHEIEQAFSRIKGSWMTGGSALKHAPAPWKPLIDGIEATEAELRLVALAGQVAQLAFEATPSQELSPTNDLPQLGKPALPDAIRPRFRRLFAAAKSADRQGELLAFIARRGYVAHPADWMPSPGDDTAPTVYLPWIAWQLARAGTREADQHLDTLDEDTWDDFSPAERRTELAAMRKASPATARELIEAKAASLAADQRYRVIELLADQLSGDDVGFLETLLSDHSGKIKSLAQALLARLGHASKPGELEAELADFLKVGKKGLLSRELKITARKLKTDAQRRRRAELFELVTIQGLCDALELSPKQFLAAWDLKTDVWATRSLAEMAAATASDSLLPVFAERLAVSSEASQVTLIADRLSDTARMQLAVKMLADPAVDFADVMACAGDQLDEMSKAQMISAPGIAELVKSIRKFTNEDHSAARTRRENAAGDELYHLGFLADTEAAGALAAMVVDAGIMAVDPKLDMLRFNELLPPRQDDAQ